MKIFWSEKSLGDLEEIYEFYSQQASIEVATKIIGKLLEKPEALLLQPEMGPVEVFKTNQPFEYRYLVEGNHKIIYRVIKEQNLIFIATVFDTRKSPIKKTLSSTPEV